MVSVAGNQLPVATPVPSATPVSKSFFSRFRSTPPLAEVATVSDDDFAKAETVAAWEEAMRQKAMRQKAMRQNSNEDRWSEHQLQKTGEADDAWKKRLKFEENQINKIAEINFVDEQIKRYTNVDVGVGVNADKLNISSIPNLLVQWHKRPRTVAELNNARLNFLDEGRRVPLKDEDEDEDEDEE